ncbi:MAG: deoxyribonuclease IV [Thermodesulfovibrionia bacterium]
MRRLGVHTSIAGGIHLSLKRAKELGCSTMQIFVHNPRGWETRKIDNHEIELFKRLSMEFDIRPIFIHSSYLINLASPSRDIRMKSIKGLSYEMRIANLLNVDGIVLHPGRSVNQDINAAIRHVSKGLMMAYEMAGCKVDILLENTAGQRGDISSTIHSIAEIIEGTPARLVCGICLDSCHAYQSGYDITTIEGIERLKDEIDRYLKPLNIKLIHLNDSKMGFKSGIDRHQHIGKGDIGIKGFKVFLSSFRGIPLILETPFKHKGDDHRNLQRVRRILRDIGE